MNGGELGTSADSIQRGLERAFGLVSRWDAIFLLDEADAFLARRGDSVEKNAPISGESQLKLSSTPFSTVSLTLQHALSYSL